MRFNDNVIREQLVVWAIQGPSLCFALFPLHYTHFRHGGDNVVCVGLCSAGCFTGNLWVGEVSLVNCANSASKRAQCKGYIFIKILHN